jgi:rubrerythrin
MSTNPWKITSEFRAIAETKEEYLAAIQKLKDGAPTSTHKKLSKSEKAHLALIGALENRIDAIDAELAVSNILDIPHR